MSILYTGYRTHDPYEAERLYAEKYGKDPETILIRPGYPVTKDHLMLIETKFCGANIMMVTHEIDPFGYRETQNRREKFRQKRKIVDFKLIQQHKAGERELQDDYEEEGTSFNPTPKQEEIKTTWIRPQPKILTDDEYLDLFQKPGYVYLLKTDNGFHKIGRSYDVEDRRTQLERDIPVVIDIEHYFYTKYYIAAESCLHKKYDSQRVKYEWFKLSNSQIKEIISIKDYGLDGSIEMGLLDDRDKN